jgi:hypothetical protein
MLVHDARTQRLLAYDGRETAPVRRRPRPFPEERIAARLP